MRLLLLLVYAVNAQKLPEKHNCLEGFEHLTDGWCYTTLQQDAYTFKDAEDACFSVAQSHLPTLSSPELNEAVANVRNGDEWIWIGLNCSSEGEWYWLDGTPYDSQQAHFTPGGMEPIDATRCDPSSSNAFVLSNSGFWEEINKGLQLTDVICNLREEGYAATGSTLSTSPSTEDLICPVGYKRYDAAGELWCFAFNLPLPPATSVDFKTAKSLCEDREGEMLPILESDEIIDALDAFRSRNDATTVWIGIVCNHVTGRWEWENGDVLDYANFQIPPPDPCNDEIRFAQTEDKFWQAYGVQQQLSSATLEEPDLPTMPVSLNCPYDMYYLDEWCYVFIRSSIEQSFADASSICASEYEADLPSISSDREAQNLMYIRRYNLGFDGEDLWMGLRCGIDGKWIWTNGEDWNDDYTNFVAHESAILCDDHNNFGHLFNGVGKWERGKGKMTKYITCTTRPSNYIKLLKCPEGYWSFNANGEQWCFVSNTPLPPAASINFEDAKIMCNQREGETLPLLPSQNMSDSLDAFINHMGADYLWIGIVCNKETMQWEWEDGQPVDYNRFDPPQTGNCTDKQRFAQNFFNKWISSSPSSGFSTYACMRKALPSDPPLPTLPHSPNCPDNMYYMNYWCYGFKKWLSPVNPLTAGNICWTGFDYSNLPSISSDQDSYNLMFIRRYYLGMDDEDLWLGLQCGSDSMKAEFDIAVSSFHTLPHQPTGLESVRNEETITKKWSWTNGEWWSGDYNEFMSGEDAHSCDPGQDMGYHLYNNFGKWEKPRPVDGKLALVDYVVCTKRPDGYTMPERCPQNTFELVYGRCFSKLNESVQFDSNIGICAQSGAKLPSVASEEENQAYLSLIDASLGLSTFWLGLVCKDVGKEKGAWAWLDGTPVTYTNFVDPFYNDPVHCDLAQDTVFSFESQGKWNAENRETSSKSGLCVLPADESIPTPAPVTCDDPWVSIDGACFLFDDEMKWTWHNAKTECENRGGSLPSIISRDQNGRVLIEISARKLIHLPEAAPQFWLGLICTEIGQFGWLDGSPYIYNNLDSTDAGCSDGYGHAFTGDEGKWIELLKISVPPMPTAFLACSKPGNPIVSTTSEVFTPVPTTTPTITTRTTTTSEPTTTTSTSTVATTTTTQKTTTTVATTTATMEVPTTTTTSLNDSSGMSSWVIALIGLGVLLIIALFTFIVYMARKRIQRLEAEIVEVKIDKLDSVKPQIHDYNLPSLSDCDEWEIDRKFVSIDYMNKLGEGAFGSVYLGRVLAKNIPLAAGKSILEMTALRNDNDSVAVKMLHENADSMAERDFRTEIDLMKNIGYHERLVNILACVTQSEPVLLIAEYCANGDLLDFMRKRRKYMLDNTTDHYDDDKIITARQQMMFAIQIAYGLEYLASRGILHRDIAARNIMVDQQETCKIGDFGLCRVIGREDENYQAQGGKLPLKWMSPEALDSYFFSTASDVWSYGILLFEIVTLGGSPYAGWPATEILTKLKQGERMDRPDNCSEDLFEVMLHCWAELPSERPTFTKLRKRLGVLLEDFHQDDYYLKLNAHANYYVFESNAS